MLSFLNIFIFYLFNSIISEKPCVTTPVNCKTCVVEGGADTCKECNDNYGLDQSGACVACSTVLANCKVCGYSTANSAMECTTCTDGNPPQNDACSVDESCTTVPANCKTCVVEGGADTCKECNDNYGLDQSGACVACSTVLANCKVCGYSTANSAMECTTCTDGNPPQNNACSDIIEIPSISESQEDESDSSNQPEQDSSNPQISDIIKCDSSLTNCAECATSSTTCTKCEDKYGLETDGKCKLCDAGKFVSVTQPCKADTPETSTCSAYVTNCKTCDSTHKVCIECNDKYGLRGGQCSECAEGLFVNTKSPCKPDCSIIENCTQCFTENRQIYCTYCGEDYHPSKDQKSCIKNVPGPCAEDVYGCLECAYEGSSICVKCDESRKLQLINDTSIPYCDCDSDSEEFYEDGCIKKDEIKEECQDENCIRCTGSPERCLECANGYGVSNGKCNKCDEGYAADGGFPCLSSCNGQHGCKECKQLSSTEFYCTSCLDGYEFHSYNRDDEGICVKKIDTTPINCSNNIVGCLECYKDTPNICNKCDSANHFKTSTLNKDICACEDNYDFVNNQCIEPPKPVTPNLLNITNYPTDEKSEAYDYKDNVVTLNPSKIPNPEEGLTYKVSIPQDAKTITIESAGPPILLDLPTTSETISIKTNSPVIVDCPENAKLQVPKNSENIEIKGNGQITINDENKDAISIGKVTIDPEDSPIKGFTSESDLNLKELDIFGDQTLSGEGTKSLSCEIAKVEGGASFTPKKMTIDTIKVGLNSLLKIDSNDVNIKNYLVAYNTSNTDIPIVFNSPFPDLKEKTIALFDQIQNELILEDTEIETAILSQFNGEKCMDTCNQMKFNGGSGFNNAECREAGTNKCNLVAMKTAQEKKPDDDKGGLSGGAIAGIVIACVVVVAAIIALLVYFLVIKKKNQSTTSTQGDSSIAI